MKKLISLFLALILCCALVPAGAEDVSVTGTWYMAEAKAEGVEIQVIDPEAITLTINEDGTFLLTAATYGASQEGTWTVADSVLSLKAQDQTTDLQISGDSLDINMGTTVVSLSRTPAEAVSFPAPVAAESADAFNGIWIPCAQVTSGMYAKMSEESIAQYGKISIEDGKVSVLYDSGSGEYVTAVTYETTFADGTLTGEDSSTIPTRMSLFLLEDGSLCFETIMSFGEGASVGMSVIYLPEAAAEEPAA